MKSLQTILLILSVGVATMFATGLYNPYKQAYENQLKEQKTASQERILSLEGKIKKIELINQNLLLKNDSLTYRLEVESKQREKNKKDYEKRIADLTSASSTELSEYFTNRYRTR